MTTSKFMSGEEKLLVQSYLETQSLDDLAREHGVYARFSTKNPRKFSLNYDQLEAKDGDPISQECRGLILETPVPVAKNVAVGSTIVLANPMKRFFNHGQGSAATVDFSDPETCFIEKVDGCCHADTVVYTEFGEMKIKEICEQELFCEVLTFNIKMKKHEWRFIEGHSIQENVENWYEIQLLDGKKVKLTGNHLVWCENISCYRRVDELTGTENLRLIDISNI